MTMPQIARTGLAVALFWGASTLASTTEAATPGAAASKAVAGEPHTKVPSSNAPVAVQEQGARLYLVALDAARAGLYDLAAVAFDQAAAAEAVPALVFNAAVAYQRAGYPGVAKARWLTFKGSVAHAESGAAARALELADERLKGLEPQGAKPALEEARLEAFKAQIRERIRVQKAIVTADVRYRYVSDDGAAMGFEPDGGAAIPFETFGWTAVGAGALVTIIGVILKVDADNLRADLAPDRRPDGIVASPTQRQAFLLADEATRQQNASTVALATGGTLLAVGIGLLVYDRVSRPASNDGGSVTGVGVGVGAAGVSMTLGGRF